MSRFITHEEKRLGELLKEAQAKPDDARLAQIRQTILAQTPVSEPKQSRSRFWRWAVVGAAASLALGLGVTFWPKAPEAPQETPPIREALREKVPQKAFGTDYIKLLDDSQEVVFAWDNMGYGADNPLLLEEEQLL